jgi:hypothetical protein
MGVGRPFRRIELRHAKLDFAGLNQLPEPIELLEFLGVGAYEGRRETDIPLRDTLEAADGREGAAVTNRGDDKLIKHRSVRKPIDSLTEGALVRANKVQHDNLFTRLICLPQATVSGTKLTCRDV